MILHSQRFYRSQWSKSSMFFFWILMFSLWSSECLQFDLSFFCFSSFRNGYIWKFSVHVLLKPRFENLGHYIASMWNEWNGVVIWTFFGTAFLCDWNKNCPFPVLWPLLSFPNLLAYWVQHFHSCFRIWNSWTGIPSPPLALLVVMLSKAHLTSHSRMSGSRWNKLYKDIK